MGVLKRKRSESEFSISSGSTFSSPPRPGSSNFNFGGMDAGMNSPIRYGATASHLPSRTMKRFRDNRLPEEEIHQNTLKMLYSAQQQHHDQTPQHDEIPQLTTTTQPAMASSRASGQRSLHAFWNIPSPATIPDMLPPPIERAALALANGQTSCEDCGTRIPASGDDAIMEIDGYHDSAPCATRCVACAKVVCGSCSVSNMGAEPRCLVCAGRDSQWARGQRISAC
ncbi:hypothetical protein CONLIGDRAFT_578933 [Coniochaeta ligniaria NRRL 30616]|uniref:Uncharacterized protein n=1 Tax=Coniochaeta ligniaria NRRL 30616 TaxID=1408157 RepID=A0A1J7ILB7_9PEZI|nr:hypothetical protein CONLIGDRAFT_578933 [Coniochaeta ligniaria NRRL 30616]